MTALPRRDVAVAAAWTAAVVAAFLAVPALGGPDSSVHVPAVGSGSWWSGLAVLLAQGAGLPWRTVRARTALLAVAAAAPVGAAVGLADTIGLTSVAVCVAVYTVVCVVPIMRAWAALVGAGVLVAAGEFVSRLRLHDAVAAAGGAAVVQAAGAVVLPLALGLVVAARRDAQRARDHEVRAAAREREARLQAAVSHERMAMARELHDIAAHHLSGIAVMTAAIGTQIDTDPAGAKEAVGQVREQSRTLLRDLRSLVGLLRDEPTARETVVASRQQTLAGLSALVDDATAAGTAVELTVLRRASGDAVGEGVGPLAQLAAYRIVQESLANAARHAPGARCRVVVDDRAEDTVVVSVTNDAPRGPRVVDPSGGFGLVGMRERAELTGADLAYGPRADGGWQVSLSIPRVSEPAFTANGPA